MESNAVSLALIVGELQDLKATVHELAGRLPLASKTWLHPREIAPMLGVSTRTLKAWRDSGRIKSTSYRQEGGGYVFHRDRVLNDINQS